MTPWGDRAVEAVARAACKSSGRCKYIGDRCNTVRCSVTPDEARAAILAYHRVLREPGEEMIAAGWSPSVHDEDLVNVLRAMVGRAEEELT
jgi:hypothetical protein